MAALMTAIDELVIANRILAAEKVCDAFGHVSMRHPEDPGKFLLSRGRAPELIEASDIMQFTHEGATAAGSGASGDSWDRSWPQAKNLRKARRCWVTWSRIVPRSIG